MAHPDESKVNLFWQGKLKRLKRLEAENNKLLTLPDELQGLQALETIKLSMNGLSSLPPSFSKLSSLTEYATTWFATLSDTHGANEPCDLLAAWTSS
jgi:Leucine-rich repeat (LRR) protein